MAPIWVRMSVWISVRSLLGLVVRDVGGEERVIKAKGRWPFVLSGMPTTQHSATEGWEEMACSMEPFGGFLRVSTISAG